MDVKKIKRMTDDHWKQKKTVVWKTLSLLTQLFCLVAIFSSPLFVVDLDSSKNIIAAAGQLTLMDNYQTKRVWISLESAEAERLKFALNPTAVWIHGDCRRLEDEGHAIYYFILVFSSMLILVFAGTCACLITTVCSRDVLEWVRIHWVHGE